MLNLYSDIWLDGEFLNECLSFVRNAVGRPEAIKGSNDDDVFATGIAFMIRENAPKFVKEKSEKLSLAEMRKQEIIEAVRKTNAGEAGQEYKEDYTNL